MATKEMAREKGQAGYEGLPPCHEGGRRHHSGAAIRAGRDAPMFGETGEVRVDETVFAEIVAFLREHRVQSVAMTEKILGCATRRESTTRTVRLVQIAHIGREGTVGLARAGTNRRRRLVGRL
jgi:hypothetical protein